MQSTHWEELVRSKLKVINRWSPVKDNELLGIFYAKFKPHKTLSVLLSPNYYG